MGNQEPQDLGVRRSMRAGLMSQGVAGGGVPKKHLLKGQRDSSAGREAPEMLACRAEGLHRA